MCKGIVWICILAITVQHYVYGQQNPPINIGQINEIPVDITNPIQIPDGIPADNAPINMNNPWNNSMPIQIPDGMPGNNVPINNTTGCNNLPMANPTGFIPLNNSQLSGINFPIGGQSLFP